MFTTSCVRAKAIAAVLGVALAAYGFYVRAEVRTSDPTYQLDIPSQSLEDALQALALVSRQRLFYQADIVSGKVNRALKGKYTTEEAIRTMLAGTDLRYEISADGVVFVRAKESVPQAAVLNDEGIRMAKASNQVSGQTAATAANEDAPQSPAGASSSENSLGKIQEIVVTAQKREERLLDVPQSMSVVSADHLAKLGAIQFRDFADTVPGLSFSTAGPGFSSITLRGVTPTISSTVGIYVDEVPYGSSTAFTQSNNHTLDVALFDLDRIEVLRGPQGTLYGASTMGGLLKYVTKRPDASGFGIDVRAGTSSTRYGGINYNGAVAVNAPIVTDKVAVRASGFYSHDGGYIDNVALGNEDIDRSDIYGGRLDLLVTPTEALRIRIGASLQNISRGGWATTDHTLAGVPQDSSLEQRKSLDQPFGQRFRLVSATVTYDLGPMTLTSISSYQTARAAQFWDFQHFVPIFAFAGSFSAIGLNSEPKTDRFTQEMRLTADRMGPFEWLVGGFYTHEISEIQSKFSTFDLAGQLTPFNLATLATPSRFEEYAAFGNLTWYLTDRFDISGGVRYASNRLRFEQIGSGLILISSPPRRSSDEVATYLANARYRFSNRATGYLRYATGYRPGGPNFNANDPTTGLPIGPEIFDADRLRSYEVGLKAETADRRFGIDLASYYIDWSNIQIGVVRGGLAVFANAPGGASVRGGELSLTARPSTGFAATAAFAYQDATLTEADPDLRGTKGERLPNVPRISASVSADYDLPVGGLQPTIGVTLRYMDDRKAGFGSTAYRLPDYTKVDLRTGFVLNQVNVQLYVHNLFDERGQQSAFLGFGLPRVAILQPRTFGIAASAEF